MRIQSSLTVTLISVLALTLLHLMGRSSANATDSQQQIDDSCYITTGNGRTLSLSKICHQAPVPATSDQLPFDPNQVVLDEPGKDTPSTAWNQVPDAAQPKARKTRPVPAMDKTDHILIDASDGSKAE
jgi:hypothetical protein